MRTTLLYLFILCLGCTSLAAQSGKEIAISGLKISPVGDEVNIEFTVTATRRAVASDYVALFTPQLETGTDRNELPSIAVIGRRAERTYARKGNEIPSADLTLRNGESTTYRTSVPFASVNGSSRLVVNGISIGCCSQQDLGTMLLAENFVREDSVRIEPVYVERELTTGEKLAQRYSFLANIDEFEAQKDKDRDQYIDDTRDLSLTVYFPVSIYTIDMDLRENRKTLDDLTTAINAISASDDSWVSHVVIAGYASPEGTTETNRRLAYNRAVALRDYLVGNTPITTEKIDIYNGAEDWKGLRREVEKTSLAEKQQVLDLIDSTPEEDGRGNLTRLNELRRLNGGRTYAWLLANIFPELRNATYIRVYYENTGRP